MSEIKSMSTQCLFIYRGTKQKNNKKATAWICKRKMVARKPKRIRRLIAFGSLISDLNNLRIIPGSGV